MEDMADKENRENTEDTVSSEKTDISNSSEIDAVETAGEQDGNSANELTNAESKSTAKGDKKKEKGFKAAMGSLFDMVEVVALSVAIVYLVFCFAFRVAVVNGPSMNQTLQDKDILLVSELFYKPTRGDVIVCQNEYIGFEEPIVKRIIAVAGDTINIDFDNWQVYVNGEPIKEDYVNYIAGMPMRQLSFERYGSDYVVPEGHVFVMGDNRNNSNDSRSYLVGPIDERLIVGHVIFRFFPFSSAGIIK